MHYIIFDFDNTLTQYNVSVKIDSLKGNENVFTNIVCTNDFRSWLQVMKNKNIKIYIMSFGYNTVIKHFLKISNLYQYFDDIYTPSSFGMKDGYSYSKTCDGKNKFIQLICNNTQSDNILLVDDDRTNIAYALKSGYKAVKVDPRTGLTESDFAYICNITKSWTK